MKHVISLACLLLLLLAACDGDYLTYERRPLEVYYDGSALVRLHTNWEHLWERPELMTVFVAKDGDLITETHVSSEVDSIDLMLGAGTYKVMVMNETFSDYYTMSFYDRTSFHEMMARANMLDGHLGYLQQPGVVGTAVDTFTIRQEDIDSHRQFLPYQQRNQAHYDTLFIHRYDTIYDMTCMLNIYVRVDNLEHLSGLTGTFSGLADGFYLSRVWRTETSGPLYLNEWERRNGTLRSIMDTDMRRRAPRRAPAIGEEGEDAAITAYVDSVYADDGLPHDWMTCRVPTFGLCHGKELMSQRQPEDNQLVLYFQLGDGTVYPCTYNVGKLIRYRNISDTAFEGDVMRRFDLDGSLRLDLNLVIDTPLPYPDLPANGGGTGFDPTVQPWEPNDSTNVIL